MSFVYNAGGQRIALVNQNAQRTTFVYTPRGSLAALAGRLAGLGGVEVNEYLLRLQAEGKELTIFADGRAIVKGVTDEGQARALYARYVGS